MTSRVTEKGQVTVPKALRDRLGIRPGDELAFTEEGGRLVAVKVGARAAVDELYGVLKLSRPTDDLIADMRGSA